MGKHSGVRGQLSVTRTNTDAPARAHAHAHTQTEAQTCTRAHAHTRTPRTRTHARAHHHHMRSQCKVSWFLPATRSIPARSTSRQRLSANTNFILSVCFWSPVTLCNDKCLGSLASEIE